MNTTPTFRITEEGPEVGVTTARLLLQHTLEKEELNENGDTPEMARKRAINVHTGASGQLPPIIVPDELPLPDAPPPKEETTAEGSATTKIEAALSGGQH